MKRVDIRSKYKRIRESFGEKSRSEWSELIVSRLLQHKYFKQANVISSYMPFGSEVNITPLRTHMDVSQTLLLPKIISQRNMNMIQYNGSTDELAKNKYNISEPVGDNYYEGTIDLVLVPGLCFNSDCYRIGYGGGYYDTFLSNRSDTYKIGLFFEGQKYEGITPNQYDIPMDEIITERGVYVKN